MRCTTISVRKRTRPRILSKKPSGVPSTPSTVVLTAGRRASGRTNQSSPPGVWCTTSAVPPSTGTRSRFRRSTDESSVSSNSQQTVQHRTKSTPFRRVRVPDEYTAVRPRNRRVRPLDRRVREGPRPDATAWHTGRSQRRAAAWTARASMPQTVHPHGRQRDRCRSGCLYCRSQVLIDCCVSLGVPTRLVPVLSTPGSMACDRQYTTAT